jgi:type IV pilus assembly protein PilW
MNLKVMDPEIMNFKMKQSKMSDRQAGFTLAELMVGMTIGLLVLSSVTSAYVSSSRAGNASQASAEQVENGRQAIEFISYDLRHAGYFGQMSSLPAPTAVLPDPCETSNLVTLFNSMAFPVQAYDAPATTPLNCLGAADFVPGTDVLVVRRASSEPLAPADVPELGAIYLQANTGAAELQIGDDASAVGTTLKADGAAATILNRDGVTSAPIQRLLVHIYFIAPCAMPANGGASCTGALDDEGSPIPTLKRLELSTVGGAAQMNIVPLVAGVENLQFDFGLDNLPSTVDSITGLIGDGTPDCEDADPGSLANVSVTAGCAVANPGAVQEWANVVHAEAHILARSYRPTQNYVDTKTYNLGLGLSALSPGGNFKRHTYSSTVRFTNVSARREIPI